jgi:hypothetical protein
MIELRQALKPYHSRIISFSPSASTRDLLQHALRGLPAHYMASADEVKNHISSSGSPGTEPAPDIIIMDATQELVEEVVRMLDADPHYRLTRVVHILMRSKTSADSTRITRCSKPLRPLVLLRLLLQLCTSEPETQTSEITTLLVGSSFDGAATPPTLRPKLGTPTSSAPSFGPYPQKITANFTKEQLEFFKSVRILIAEGLSHDPSVDMCHLLTLTIADNLVAQRLLSRQLQNLGFEVVTSSNGLEAVERWWHCFALCVLWLTLRQGGKSRNQATFASHSSITTCPCAMVLQLHARFACSSKRTRYGFDLHVFVD